MPYDFRHVLPYYGKKASSNPRLKFRFVKGWEAIADMARERESNIPEALSRLVLADVWELAPGGGTSTSIPGRRSCVVKSPFREDKNPSFSVFDGGKAFSDKARDGIKGGVWEFVKLCKPEWSDGQVAAYVIEKAGIVEKKPEGGSRNAGFSPEEKREWRLEKQRREKEVRVRVHKEAQKARQLPPRGKALEYWPSCVSKRYFKGYQWLHQNFHLVEELCSKRGWPVKWAEGMEFWKGFSYPLLPWYDEGQKGAKRGFAFSVEIPLHGKEDGDDYPVGYHQKYFNVSQKRSSWLYVPHEVRASIRNPSGFQREMMEDLKSREGGYKTGDRVTPPLPFVLGELDNPELVIITEGQWDALTVWGALGHFNMDGAGLDIPTAVFGIRGAEGVDCFLSYYAEWLSEVKPKCWVLADNDVAGKRWFKPAMMTKPSFISQLKQAGCSKVVATALKCTTPDNTDFNDYFREKQPNIGDMLTWMHRLGLI